MSDPHIVGRSYAVGRKLGAGSFGEIFLATHVDTNEKLAVKVESVKAKHPQLMYEAKLLKHLQGGAGIAQVYFCDTEGDHNFVVMDLLGKSLEDLFNACNRKFTLGTVIQLADQMLLRIEFLHSKNFIHRDIKPENFLVGRGDKSRTLFLIDFGLGKKYRDPKSHKHVPYKENQNLTGTARFASVNAHLGLEQSRRDDIEAIGYVLMYFLRGSLPWQGLKANTKHEKYRQIMEMKMGTPLETLSKGYPKEFSSYLKYCRALRFEAKPDYNFLRRLFKDVQVKDKLAPDLPYDWELLPIRPEGVEPSPIGSRNKFSKQFGTGNLGDERPRRSTGCFRVFICGRSH